MAALQLCSQIFNTIELDRYWFQILPTSFEVMDKVDKWLISAVSFFICKMWILITLCVLVEQIEKTRTIAQHGVAKCLFFFQSLSYFRLPTLGFPWTTSSIHNCCLDLDCLKLTGLFVQLFSI